MLTKTLKVIVLDRFDFRENDTKVILYSREMGKLGLVARGTKKLHSKLAGHLEPIILSQVMFVPGRNFNYIGSAKAENCFLGIKNSLNKIWLAGRVLSSFDKLIKEGQKDEDVFDFLFDFLNWLDNVHVKINEEFIYNIFILKLIQKLGYEPQLYKCSECNNNISSQLNFVFSKGGLVCFKCQQNLSIESMLIDKKLLNFLRLTFRSSFNDFIKSYNFLSNNFNCSLRRLRKILLFNIGDIYIDY